MTAAQKVCGFASVNSVTPVNHVVDARAVTGRGHRGCPALRRPRRKACELSEKLAHAVAFCDRLSFIVERDLCAPAHDRLGHVREPHKVAGTLLPPIRQDVGVRRPHSRHIDELLSAPRRGPARMRQSTRSAGP